MGDAVIAPGSFGTDGPSGTASTVGGASTVGTPGSSPVRLDAIVKAYDIRGLVGTQLTSTRRARSGSRSAVSSPIDHRRW